MPTPTTRLLSLLELLQSRQSIAGQELAGLLEIDIRSVRRYIAMLEELGIPVLADRGRIGGYRLMPGFKLPPLMLSENESIAVLLGLSAAKNLGLSSENNIDIESAQAKIKRVLPEKLRQRMESVEQSTFWARGSYSGEGAGANAGFIAQLGDASRQNQQVILTYCRNENELTERTINPYGLVHRNGRWYVIGYCHLRLDNRLFRIDRIKSATVTSLLFKRPTGFDVLAETLASIRDIPRAYTFDVLLTITVEQLNYQIPTDLVLMEEMADRRIRIRGFTDNLGYLATAISGLGCRFEILEPDELRTAIRHHAQRLIECSETTGLL